MSIEDCQRCKAKFGSQWRKPNGTGWASCRVPSCVHRGYDLSPESSRGASLLSMGVVKESGPPSVLPCSKLGLVVWWMAASPESQWLSGGEKMSDELQEHSALASAHGERLILDTSGSILQ